MKHGEAASLLIYRAPRLSDNEPYITLPPRPSCLLPKPQATLHAAACAHRRFGYTREYPFARFMRDAKITEIYEGTNEVQKMVISGYMGLK